MTTPPSQTIKLLVIEDNAGDADIVQAYLHKSSMVHEQTNVATLEQAKATLSEQSFDAVMVDLNLPDSTGVATVEVVVAAAKTAPVVAMTGTKSEKLGLQCIEAGAQDFISKSDFTALSLERSINFAMARQSETASRGRDVFVSQYLRLGSEGRSAPTSSAMLGIVPIKELLGKEYEGLQTEYCNTLAMYLKSLVSTEPPPKRPMVNLAQQLGRIGAGPRDLIDLHVEALGLVVANVVTPRAQALAIDGRLMALELMGLLVDYYRHRTRREHHDHTEPTGNI